MEMNTRLQVEHPVTEAITGLDLVELQLRVAAGEKLPFAQADLAIDGHAFEARLYAEDPKPGSCPPPAGSGRCACRRGRGSASTPAWRRAGEVTPYYDPMIAKIIAHGPTREEALNRLASALADTVVAGPRSNVSFLKALAEAPGFRAGHFDTGFIDRHLEELGAVRRPVDPRAVAAGALALVGAEQERIAAVAGAGSVPGPWDIADGFQLHAGRANR